MTCYNHPWKTFPIQCCDWIYFHCPIGTKMVHKWNHVKHSHDSPRHELGRIHHFPLVVYFENGGEDYIKMKKIQDSHLWTSWSFKKMLFENMSNISIKVLGLLRFGPLVLWRTNIKLSTNICKKWRSCILLFKKFLKQDNLWS